MEASGGRTGRDGEALRGRETERSSSSDFAESWGEEPRTLEGALKDSSKGLGSR